MGVSRTQRERVAIRQQAVLEAYEIYGTVAKACEVARVARSEHYRWLRNRRYAARFREAEEHAIQALETEARRRAMVGIEKPIFYKGHGITQLSVCDGTTVRNSHWNWPSLGRSARCPCCGWTSEIRQDRIATVATLSATRSRY